MRKWWIRFLLALAILCMPSIQAYAASLDEESNVAPEFVFFGLAPLQQQTILSPREQSRNLALAKGPVIPNKPLVAFSEDSLSGSSSSNSGTNHIGKFLNYKIKSGDSLYSIAKMFNTDVQSLLSLNAISNPGTIYVGEVLQVPVTAEDLPVATREHVTAVMNATLTAYTAGYESTGKHPGDPGYGITASGATVAEGRTIAVDPNQIPLGSKVYIEGIGYRVAEDTGGAIIGNRIDVYMSNVNDAIRFGVKKGVKVYVLSTPNQSPL